MSMFWGNNTTQLRNSPRRKFKNDFNTVLVFFFFLFWYFWKARKNLINALSFVSHSRCTHKLCSCRLHATMWEHTSRVRHNFIFFTFVANTPSTIRFSCTHTYILFAATFYRWKLYRTKEMFRTVRRLLSFLMVDCVCVREFTMFFFFFLLSSALFLMRLIYSLRDVLFTFFCLCSCSSAKNWKGWSEKKTGERTSRFPLVHCAPCIPFVFSFSSTCYVQFTLTAAEAMEMKREKNDRTYKIQNTPKATMASKSFYPFRKSFLDSYGVWSGLYLMRWRRDGTSCFHLCGILFSTFEFYLSA